jgi:ribosomal-protein-serine acetyltransferase
MKFTNWKIDKIENILADEFFHLIEINSEKLKNAFPVTLSHCLSLEKTVDFIKFNKNKEKLKENYFFYIRNLETKKLIGYLGIKKIDYSISKC